MRVVEVAHTRLPRWLAGFEERHGSIAVDGGAIRGSDGVGAMLRSWDTLEGSASVGELIERTRPPAQLAVLLVRRGGYAVGIAQDDALGERKVGRRHVQSRTAAGGWSQQRFARRRANQADELVGAVRDHATRLLAGTGADGLVLGGDRTLAAAVLQDPRLAGLRALPTRELYDLPDPTSAVLATALQRARSVRIEIEEP